MDGKKEFVIELPKLPDELSLIDEDIKDIFEGTQYIQGMPLNAQLCKEIRLLREAMTKPKRTNKTKTVEYSDEFEQAWKLYPKKSGNKKIEAYQQWNARIEDYPH